MITILHLFIIFALFLGIELLAYKITEVWDNYIFNKVKFLDHKPWNCRICMQFWLNTFAVAIYATVFKHWFPTIIWLALTILETIALKIQESNKYIDDEDYGQY